MAEKKIVSAINNSIISLGIKTYSKVARNSVIVCPRVKAVIRTNIFLNSLILYAMQSIITNKIWSYPAKSKICSKPRPKNKPNMRYFSLTLIILFLCSFSAETKHPIHVSITNIEYNKSKNKIEISVKLFTDDFEKILSNINKKHVSVTRNDLNTQKIIVEYIKKNLIIKLDFKEKELKFVRREIKKDNTVWLYFECEYSKRETLKYEIRNTLMNDLYSDQKNLLIYSFPNKEGAYKFNNKVVSLTIE